MTLRTIRIFVTIAEEKTMHAAAKKLYISQPSVSQAISELEKEYHVQLFERLSQRLYITAAGEKLLAYAYHLLRTYEDMEQLLISQGTYQCLRLGASVSVGTCLIPELAGQLKIRHPDIDLQVTVNNTSRIEQMLLESQLDAGIVEGTIVNPDLLCTRVCEDELLIVAPPNHPLASQLCIPIERLAGETFISRESGSNDRNQFEQFLQSHHIPLTKSWTCTNTQAIINAVLAGHGLAILSRMLVEPYLKEKKLTALSLEQVHIRRDIRLVYHKDKLLSPEMEGLAKLCRLSLCSVIGEPVS